MFLNQVLNARLGVSVTVLLLAMAGCSSSHSLAKGDANVAETSAPSAAPASAPVEDDMTATEAAAATAGAEAPPAAAAPSDPGPVLNPSAPKRYTVKHGDTLWGIATVFLRDPWLWPEIWYVNPQVENPHLIYPGDVLALAYGADGRPQIRVEEGGAARLDPRLRSSPLDGAIPTIPYSAIAAFLSRPTVVSADQMRHAPHVLAFRDEHEAGGTGHEFYVRNLSAAQGTRFAVIHVEGPLRDPDTGRVLGYQGVYTATAVVTRAGNPATALLTDAARETLRGDLLFAVAADTPANLAVRAPTSAVKGRIMSVVDGVQLIGQYQVVVINRGQQHGIDAGDVLAVDRAGEVVRDTDAHGWSTQGISFAARVRLPDERAGTLLVFETFDRMSYALVVGASGPIHVADIVRNP